MPAFGLIPPTTRSGSLPRWSGAAAPPPWRRDSPATLGTGSTPRSRARSADHVVGHLGPARGADHPVVERLERTPSTAEHTRIVRLGEHDGVPAHADLQRIADLDPE